jgi:carbon monoxide dehydrogenase subunit G
VRLQQSFDVDAPIERVWSALIDVEQVAPCLPGASITGRGEDGSYDGAFAVKIGPTSAAYTGKLQMTGVEPESHTATMRANGTDKRGQGGASATIVSKLSALGDDRTRVEVDTDYRITGRLARFGRGGMIEDISEKLLRQFADNLQASLSGPVQGAPAPEAAPESPQAEPASPQAAGVSKPAPEPLDLGNAVAASVLGRLRANPLPLWALLALALLVIRRRGRRC